MFSVETAQQALLAQHPDLQAPSAGALERMHDRAERPTVAATSAAATASEIRILLNIDLRIAQVRPRVEKSVHDLVLLLVLRFFRAMAGDLTRCVRFHLHFVDHFARKKMTI
ncbi:MAG: hypothetical protein DME61_03375 [Verrucomicrobia bacterium]|nr:MAG: hypothetical protein DME61_03375 [Verrucomicrobiota bacterium]